MKKVLLGIFAIITGISFGQSTDIVINAANDGTTFTTCLGGIYDSGGTGAGADYSNDENYVVTICPSTPGDDINLIWTVFSLDPTDLVAGPPTDADHINIYDGDNTSAPTLGTYYAGDLTPGDVFGASIFNPTGCLTIEFVSNATGTGNYAATVTCTTPCDPPTAAGMIVGADSPAGDSIAVCIGETVTFTDDGSTPGSAMFTLENWVWHWMDGTDNDTLTGPDDVTHVFTEPGQYIIQLEVIDDNDCSNNNATDIQVFVTTPPTFDPFPGDTSLCVGESITLVATPDAYEVEWSGFPLEIWDEDNCMEDLTGVLQTTPLTITGYDDVSLSDLIPDVLEICVDIEHSFMGDFILQVQCPTGQVMTLHEQLGGGTYLGVPEDYPIDCDDPSTFGTPWHYCFTIDAAETWEAAAASVSTLPEGDYLPVDPDGFAALDGCPINGTWNLLFTDMWGADDGSIPGWSIVFADYLTPDVTTFTPDIGSGSDSSYWDLSGTDITSSSADGNEITITPSTDGSFTYNYFAVNDFGCSFDTSITITVDPAPTMDAGLDTSICDGSPVVIGSDELGGSAGCTYVLELIDTFGDGWNGNTVTVWINGVATTYTIPPGGDFMSINLDVEHGDLIELQWNATGSWQSECELYLYDPEGTLIHSDGTGFTVPSTALYSWTADCYSGVVFEWTPDDGSLDDPTIPNPTASPATTTTYTLTVYPVGHPLCSSSDEVTISLGVSPDVGTDGTATLCLEGVPEDLFPYLGGTPETGGEWYDDAGALITMPFDPGTMPAGLYEYRKDSAGCVASAFVDVTIIEVTGDVTITDSDCAACNGEVQVLPLTGDAPYTFSDDGVTYVPGDTFTGLCGAGATYTFNLMDDNGCVGSVDAIVDDTNFPTIDDITVVDASCNTICDGSVTITASFASEYTITDAAGTTSSNSTGSFTGLCAGDYTVSIDNGFGCTDDATFTINEPTPVNIIDLTPDFSICPGETTTLTVNGSGGVGPYTYTWESGGTVLGTGTSIDITPTDNMTVCVTMSEACPSPTDTECMNITVPTPLVPTLTSDITDGCEPVTITFENITTGGTVATTEWEFTDGRVFTTTDMNSLTVLFEEPGTYGVTMTTTSDIGCVYEATFPDYVSVYSLPIAAFNHFPIPATVFETEVEFTDQSSNDVVSWEWIFGPTVNPNTSSEQNPVAVYPEGVAYDYTAWLYVTNDNGCIDSSSATVSVVNDVLIYAPNVFTPDGDQYNETWRVYVEGIDIYDFHLTIFNRWGEIVWESYSANAEWNGTYGNQGLVQDGTYVWVIEAKDAFNDKRYEWRGTVNVLK